MLESQSWRNKVKVEKMFVKTFDYYHHKFNFGNFSSFSVKL